MKPTALRKTLLFLGAAAAAGALLTGCSGDDDESTPTAMPTATEHHASPTPQATTPGGTDMSSEAGPDTAASGLRSALTSLLQEHVYLAGTATGAALRGDTAGFEAAAATLDANSVALSDAIGSVYGTDAGAAFLGLWRTHIGFFVDYTQGKAANDTAKIDAARMALDGYGQDFGAFLESANPNLSKDAVAEELKPHVATLIAAIDLQAAGDPGAYDALAEAASHMPHTAEILAGGIATQFPDTFPGEVGSDGAGLRAALTALLQEHVYLAGTATGAALRGDTADFEAAAATLDANSVALSDAIGSVYGTDAGAAFLGLWRTHIGFFVDYTQGKAANDTAKIDAARMALDGYGQDFGAFLESANPNLSKDAVAEELKPHVATLIAAIDLQAAGDPGAYDALAEAASHMPHTAEILAGGIATQFPDMFA